MNDKDFKRKRKEFEVELHTLTKKNKDSVFYVELAKDYLLKLKNINTLNDLNTLKQKFIKDLNNLNYKINYFKLKKSFKECLSKELNDNPNDLEIQELIKEYERKLFDINTLEKLNFLIGEFENSLNKLHSIKHQEMLNRKKTIFLNNLISVENSYSDQETIELLDFCRKKILEIKTFNDLEELEQLFKEKFKRIKELENSVLIFKEELKKQFLSYLDGVYKEEYQELVDDYLEMLRERETFNELKELDASFHGELDLLNKEIKNKEERCINYKESNKRVWLFKFYQLAEKSSYDKIIQAKDLLIKGLEVIDGATIRDIDAITVFLSNLDFSNITESIEKIKFFEFSKSDRVKILNREYFEKRLITKNPIEEELEFLNKNDTNIKNKVKKAILRNFHSYAITMDIKSILMSLDDLERILNIINDMQEYELNEKKQVFLNINFKDMNRTNNLLNSLKDSSNIYIDYKNGKLATVKIEGEEVYLMPLDEYGNNIYIISLEELNNNYISVREFFSKAIYVNGQHINEINSKNNISELLYIHGQEYLYFYKNLMLVYYGNGFGINSNSLNFITSSKGYEWNMVKDNLQSDTIKEFRDRDFCEDAFIKQVNERLDSYEEVNKYKRSVSSNYALPSGEENSKKI